MIPGHEKHPDFVKLHEIGKAIMRKQDFLPSVRCDSAAWRAWRQWYSERGLECRWSDKQPPDAMMTVVQEYPPADIDELHAHWVKSKGRKLELVE